MPYVNESTALSIAESVRESFEDEYDIEDVVKQVLTNTPCYYASNPTEIDNWITEWMTREAEEQECEDYRKPRVRFDRGQSFAEIAKQEQQKVLDENESRRER